MKKKEVLELDTEEGNERRVLESWSMRMRLRET